MTVLIPYCKKMQPTNLLASIGSGKLAFIMFRVMHLRYNRTRSAAF